jgi:aryl sulfotransferase
VFSPRAKYVYIGRDGRDVLWSLYNHHATANDLWYKAINESPGLIGPPVPRPSADILQYWNEWMERDGYPFWSIWENVRSWWAIRDLPNVSFVHFADLKRDMEGQMRGLARFLDIAVDKNKWPRILELCSFAWMKANGAKSVPLNGAMWEGGAQAFINKGVNGRWQTTLSAAQSAAYEARAVKELGAECARWLKEGEQAV